MLKIQEACRQTCLLNPEALGEPRHLLQMKLFAQPRCHVSVEMQRKSSYVVLRDSCNRNTSIAGQSPSRQSACVVQNSAHCTLSISRMFTWTQNWLCKVILLPCCVARIITRFLPFDHISDNVTPNPRCSCDQARSGGSIMPGCGP